ncbi:MAG: Gfo/Idh/MocA family protein [Tractidigestivibacter sp.]|jgi:predicted dehydrogenase|uniref:Gfo/Idh/MocA family protein n=1 Tax=Tractidigestivibacter sp. TaxID=2847320 RepID=UPI003D8F2110
MDKIRIATIGSSLIAQRFLDALDRYDGATYAGAYSRDPGRARELSAAHGGSGSFSDLDVLAASPAVDAVYVASPNALHAGQAAKMVAAGKHVLVEKSFGSNRAEAASVFSAAREKGVVALEAMRPVHAPGFKKIQETLPKLGEVRLVYLGFSKVTSRISRFRAGERLNIFDTRFSAGALMDIGVYCVEPAIALFGSPERVSSSVVTAPVVGEEPGSRYGTIDLAGTITLSYPGKSVVLSYGKLTDDLISCQIQGEEGTLLFDGVSTPGNLRLCVHEQKAMTWGTVGGAEQAIPVDTPENDMVCELDDFCRAVRGEKDALAFRDACEKVTLDSLAVMDEVRSQAGVRFPADDAR